MYTGHFLCLCAYQYMSVIHLLNTVKVKFNTKFAFN